MNIVHSLALPVWERQFFEDLEEKDLLFSFKAVCRTAPATPGLLTMKKNKQNKPVTRPRQSVPNSDCLVKVL